MRDFRTRLLNDPLLAGVGLAFLLFAAWQAVNHYFLMNYLMAELDMSMLYYHYLSFLAEILISGVIALFASRALAAKNQQLEELDRQKDLLTSALVHDLRQPLTAVLGGLEGVVDDPGLPKSTRELAEIAHLGADQLLGMVNDLLDISRLEAGHALGSLRPVALPELLAAGVRPIAPLAAAHGLGLTVALPDDLPPVLGDAERLRRVVTNLVGNALKFTPPGGRVEVTAELDPGGGHVRVRVSDTGPGIAPEHQRAIFDKFAVLQKAVPTGRTSTGLGLAFCKLIVEAHGGRIWVESTPGEGSTFVFTLPVAPQGQGADHPPRAAQGEVAA
jgi:signal transduction histidine kinase